MEDPLVYTNTEYFRPASSQTKCQNTCEYDIISNPKRNLYRTLSYEEWAIPCTKFCSSFQRKAELNQEFDNQRLRSFELGILVSFNPGCCMLTGDVEIPTADWAAAAIRRVCCCASRASWCWWTAKGDSVFVCLSFKWKTSLKAKRCFPFRWSRFKIIIRDCQDYSNR